MLKISFFILVLHSISFMAFAQQAKAHKYWKKGNRLMHYEKYENSISRDKARRAMVYFDQALEYDSHHVPSINGRGKALYYLGTNNLAIFEFDKVLNLDSTFAEAYNYKGMCLNNLDKLYDAEYCFEQSIALDSSNAEFYSNYGDFFYTNERYEEALAAYSKAIERNPKDIFSYLNRTVCAMNLKLYDDALRDALKNTQLAPKFEKVWNNLGLSYYFLKQYEQAVVHLEHAKRMLPDKKYGIYNTKTLNNLANAYHALGNEEKACINWHRALEKGYQYKKEWKELYGIEDPAEMIRQYCP